MSVLNKYMKYIAYDIWMVKVTWVSQISSLSNNVHTKNVIIAILVEYGATFQIFTLKQV